MTSPLWSLRITTFAQMCQEKTNKFITLEINNEFVGSNEFQLNVQVLKDLRLHRPGTSTRLPLHHHGNAEPEEPRFPAALLTFTPSQGEEEA